MKFFWVMELLFHYVGNMHNVLLPGEFQVKHDTQHSHWCANLYFHGAHFNIESTSILSPTWSYFEKQMASVLELHTTIPMSRSQLFLHQHFCILHPKILPQRSSRSHQHSKQFYQGLGLDQHYLPTDWRVEVQWTCLHTAHFLVIRLWNWLFNLNNCFSIR